MIDHRFPRPSARRGAFLALVLASMFVASLLGLALVEFLLRHHRQMAVLADRQQCGWLADSGMERALARIAASPDYSGETWNIPADQIGAGRPAEVTIKVTKVTEPRTGRKIQVEARFPRGPAACRREFLLTNAR